MDYVSIALLALALLFAYLTYRRADATLDQARVAHDEERQLQCVIRLSTIADVVGELNNRADDKVNTRRALTACRNANAKEAEAAEREERKPKLLVPIALHECRYSYVSLMHAAGLSLEVIGDLVGHSSGYVTDCYRHLFEGRAAEVALRFDKS